MSLKQSDSVLSLFYFRIPKRPILTSFMRSRTTKPPPQIKMSPTRLSRQEQLKLFFFLVSVRREKIDMLLSISPKRIPPCFHGPLTEEEMREDPRPEQVGLGYRAVSAVGVKEDVLVRFIVGV